MYNVASIIIIVPRIYSILCFIYMTGDRRWTVTQYLHFIYWTLLFFHDLLLKDETGSPGLVVGVSVDGQQVWLEGKYSTTGFRGTCSRMVMSLNRDVKCHGICCSVCRRCSVIVVARFTHRVLWVVIQHHFNHGSNDREINACRW